MKKNLADLVSPVASPGRSQHALFFMNEDPSIVASLFPFYKNQSYWLGPYPYGLI
jgi:hypothetical protein